MLSLKSLLFPLNASGFLILGAPSDQFARLQLKEQLLELDQKGVGSLMMFMKQLIPVQELMDERDGKEGGKEGGEGKEGSGSVGEVDASGRTKKVPSVMYSLAVFKKKLDV